VAVDEPRHGWWWPFPAGSAYVRAHYVLPDGWSLCGRWRRTRQGPPICGDIHSLPPFDDGARSLCKECLARRRHTGKRSKLAIGLGKLGAFAAGHGKA
jgi:hypothetical protein